MPACSPPVLLEVLALMPLDLRPCAACQQLTGAVGIDTSAYREMHTSYPKHLLEQAERLADWLRGVAERFSGRVQCRVIDPLSLPAVLKSLRHGLHRYPSFIIDGKMRYSGEDLSKVERMIALQASWDK